MHTTRSNKNHATRPKNLLFISLSNKRTLDNSIHQYILDYLKKRFDNIYVLCRDKYFHIKEENIHYCGGKFLSWIKHIKKILKVDYIYINDFFVGGLFGVLIKKKIQRFKKAKLVFRCGSPWKYKIDSLSTLIKTTIVQITKPIVIKNSDKVVYNSKSIVQKQYKHDWDVVYNGVDTKLFRPMPNVKSIDKEKLNLLFIGNINKEKGLDYLFKTLKNIRLREKVNLTIVGDGSLLQKYKDKYSFANYLGRKDRKELPKIINQHDVLINPSYVESFSNVILEAMACGKKVIAADVYGNREIITDCQDGFIVQAKNYLALRKAIKKLILNPKMIKASKYCRKNVLAKFNEQKQTKMFYEKLLKIKK